MVHLSTGCSPRAELFTVNWHLSTQKWWIVYVIFRLGFQFRGGADFNVVTIGHAGARQSKPHHEHLTGFPPTMDEDKLAQALRLVPRQRSNF